MYNIEVTSKNPLTDESAALSLALLHKYSSRSSCYACEFLFELPNKLLAARSAIEFLEMPWKNQPKKRGL